MNYREKIEEAKRRAKRSTPGGVHYCEAEAARRYWEALDRGADTVEVKRRRIYWQSCRGSVEAVRRWEEARQGIA